LLGLVWPVLAALVAGATTAQQHGKKPAPKVEITGVFVLDNCDPEYKGKEKYADNLSYIDAAGKVVFRVSGLNNCESIGSNHMVAVDQTRGWVWILENVGHTVRKYDRAGKELLVLKDIHASALAVDPDTGNLWVVTSRGTIHGDKTVVFDAKGKRLTTYDISGWDIAYDKKGKAFWIAGRNLARIGVDNSTLVIEGITAWCSSAVAVNPMTGAVWVAAREHPDVPTSNAELLTFDSTGKLTNSIQFGQKDPFHVSVDHRDGAVWVALLRHSVRGYSAGGKLEAEHKLEALACQADPATGGVWVVTPEEVVRLDRDGKVQARARHKGKTTQAWIAGG
jgi:hypothetical protein